MWFKNLKIYSKSATSGMLFIKSPNRVVTVPALQNNNLPLVVN